MSTKPRQNYSTPSKASNALALIDPDAAIQHILDNPDDWARAFLQAYDEHYAALTPAAEAAGVHPETVKARIARDTVFATLFDAAKDRWKDAVRAELNRRAITPSERPVYHKGELVDTILEYDNRHLEWLAERLMPEEFHLPLVVQFVGGDDADFTFRMGEADLPLELPPGDVIEHPDEPDQPVA